jgi:ATP-dependent DNA helicase RecQ
MLCNLKICGLNFVVKKEQEKALKSLFFGKDVVGILPTGFGKSLIFQLLVLLMSEKFQRQLRQGQLNRNTTILVICPLRSLIDDKLTEVQDLGISASSLPEPSKEDIKGENFI